MKNKYDVWLLQDKDEPCIFNVVFGFVFFFSTSLSDFKVDLRPCIVKNIKMISVGCF